MPPPVLRAAGIGKRFGQYTALDRVDLSIEAGEVVALMGANGAGKSTLVKILSGVYRADSGVLTLADKPYLPSSPHDAVRHGVVTVHQAIADAVVPSLSVADNLLLDLLCDPEAPWFLPARARRAAAAKRAARVGLEVDLDAPLGSVPLAAQQRVTIARALAAQPKLLILDEPTASLSALDAARLFDLIEQLRAEGVAILLVSHRQGDLRRMADRVVIMRDGRIVGELKRPIDFDAALEIMLGRPLRTARTAQTAGAARVRSAVPTEADIAIDTAIGIRRRGVPSLVIRGLRLRGDSAPFDFDVDRGEIVAITGPIGSGKSRFARTLFGLSQPIDGSVTLDDVRWQPRSPSDAIRAGVFMLGEDRRRTSLFPDSVPFATIAGTIGFPFLRRWFGGGIVHSRREHRIALEAIERFGIRCRGPADRPSRLSGGNQQKVALARWHAEPARVLLLDEPFQGIDAGARADIVELLRRHAHSRATLVFVSDLEEALEVADRIVHFDRGAPDLAVAPSLSDVSASASPSILVPTSQ